jgi:ABC-type sugar transport system substrate-binding protein
MATRRDLLAGAASVIFAAPLFSSVTRAADPVLKVPHPTIGVVVPQLLIEFWNDYLAFMKLGAKQLGVNLIVVDAQNSPERMIRSIQDLAARKVDGIIFTAYWSVGTRGLSIAKDAGIPVAITDTHPDYPPQTARFPNYISFVGPSDEDMGASIGKALIDATPAGPDGKKRIGIVNGTAGTSVAVNRRKGFAALLKQHPEVIVEGEVNGDFERETALAAFQSFYIGHSDIRGVWVASGGMASGVMTALRNRGKIPGKDVVVVCIDLETGNRKALKDGELLFDMGGHWLSGGFALLALYDAIEGHTLPANVADFHMKMLPLTKSYVPDFEKDFPNNLPDYDFKANSLTWNPNAKPGVFQVPNVEFFRSKILGS